MEAIKAYRHGDVLIINREGFKVPDSVELKPIKVLFAGKNHDHYFSEGEAIFAEKDGKRYLRVVKDAMISHGRGASSEHATKPIPAGDYEVQIQTETDHVRNVRREVID